MRFTLLIAFVAGLIGACSSKRGTGTAGATGSDTLLNVSYDPTRELYDAINKRFAEVWRKDTGHDLRVKQSHAGSGKQARAVIDGLGADIVTLALGYDIDQIASKGLINKDWQSRIADHSSPYTSTIVFLVRKGNPKGIKDWSDLIKDGVEVITPNPKTSGGARWNHLAAFGWALRNNANDEAKAIDYLAKLYQHVPVLDSGARGATTTFVERQIGDVLLAWENEAQLATRQLKAGEFEIVVPTLSILAEPPVSVVDKNVDKNGNRKLAEAYLAFLSTPEAQEIIAQNHYRPRNATVAAKYAADFPKVELLEIDKDFGGWAAAQAKHFSDGGIFDRIWTQKAAGGATP